MRGSVVGQPSAVVRIFRSAPKPQNGHILPPRTHSRSVSDSHGVRIRQFDYSGREIYSSPRIREESYSPKWRPLERPESEQSMVSEASYHTAYQDSSFNLPTGLNGHVSDYTSDHISDTATIGRPETPVTEVRSIGVNTEDVLPAEIIPPTTVTTDDPLARHYYPTYEGVRMELKLLDYIVQLINWLYNLHLFQLKIPPKPSK